MDCWRTVCKNTWLPR